jgi:hypothetical protein
LWWPTASAALLIIGAFGPWAKALGFVSVSLVDRYDGWACVAAGIVALITIYHYATRSGGRPRCASMVGTVAAGLVGLGVFVADAPDVIGSQSSDEGLFEGVDLIQPGWGLWLAGLSALSLTLAGLYLFLAGAPKALHAR